MGQLDRRRVAIASVFTLVALPALWLISHEAAGSSTSPSIGAANVDLAVGADTAPSTTAYEPKEPMFVGGEDDPVSPGIVDVAVPPAPGTNETLAKASYHRYSDPTARPCTTLLAPDGATLTVENVDNGQSTTCRNTLGIAIPTGADIVLDTNVYAEIADLPDAPVPVRVSW